MSFNEKGGNNEWDDGASVELKAGKFTGKDKQSKSDAPCDCVKEGKKPGRELSEGLFYK